MDGKSASDRKPAPGRPLPDGLSCMVKVILVPPPETLSGFEVSRMQVDDSADRED